MSVSNKISTLVQNQFPDFYKEDGENFLLFIEAYYEYLEQTGKLTDGIANLTSYRDIDTTTNDFIEYYRREFLPSVPIEMQADKTLLIKNVNLLNQTRGSEASYRLLFRSLYNEDINIEYPSENILKVSDSDWKIDRYLVIDYNEQGFDLVGKSIVGTDSLATALVEDVVRRTIRGRDLMQVYLSNIVGTFTHKEPIRLRTDVNSSGFTPNVEAGINVVTVNSAGGGFSVGDVVNIVSDDIGEFAKVVITGTQDLEGSLTFAIVDGGSGYRGSTVSPGSKITQSTVNYTSAASFTIEPNDFTDNQNVLFLNSNLINDNNRFVSLAPTVTFADGADRKMSSFANTLLSAPDFGFVETLSEQTGVNYRDHKSAKLVIANTSDPSISASDSLFGVTSGANATVVSISRAYNSTDVVLEVDGYKNFSTSEQVNIETSDGTTVGTVSSFSGNTVGHHVLNISNTQTISVGQELVGVTSGAFGVVKELVASAASNTYVRVTANTTANLTSQFDTGPIKPYTASENIRLVNTSTVVGTAKASTSNATIENIYTSLNDSLIFTEYNLGTIAELSSITSGSGYETAPTISVVDNDVKIADIGEQYVTIQNDDVNWGTGNSFFTTLSTDDRLEVTGGASGYVMGGSGPGEPITTVQYANGTYEMVVRVWQDLGQRTGQGKSFSNNSIVTLKTFTGSYTPGYTADTRTLENTGNATIRFIDDQGVLGDNSNITASVGANGSITSLRIVDSGFSYKDGESVTLANSTSTGVSGAATISLRGDANSEGYFASSKGHVSSKRGFLQDGDYYQEFSYEVQSPVSLNKYRDVALKLVHPAGNKLFGKYRTQSNVDINVTATSDNAKLLSGNGTIALTNSSFDITGTSTTFTNEFANGDVITIEYGSKEFYSTVINIVNSNTSANLKSVWAKSDISSANVYYKSGTI